MIPELSAWLFLMAQDPLALPADCTQAVNTLEINACVNADLTREASRMNRYLDAARTRARESDEGSAAFQPTQQAAWLSASQSAWQAYGDIVCDGVWDSWKSGTIRTVMSLGCRIRLTRERTHHIWADHLTYMDSTEPILPEPSGSAQEDEPLRE